MLNHRAVSVVNSNRPTPPDFLTDAGQNLENLPDQVWLWLLKDAERFAQKQIKRYRWRGARGGVLPGGFDAGSIAAQAVSELFQSPEDKADQTRADQTF